MMNQMNQNDAIRRPSDLSNPNSCALAQEGEGGGGVHWQALEQGDARVEAALLLAVHLQG